MTIYIGAFGTRTRFGQITFTGERIDEPPRVPAPFRVMEDWVLAYVTDGQGSYRFVDGREAPVGPGTVILVPPHVRHWYGTVDDRPWTETFVVFSGPLFDLTLPTSAAGSLEGPREPKPAPSIDVVRGIVRAPESRITEAEHRLLALADWLVDIVGNPGSRPSAVIEEAAHRLAADTSAELDLSELAASLGLSYTTFRRRFAAELNQSPGAYRDDARLVGVAGMLKLTDMTNREIARRFGFVDEFHMSRRFKAQFGVSPREYRRRP